jgi:hypothetical protein
VCSMSSQDQLGSVERAICLSLAKSTVVVESVDAHLSILPNVDELAVGITHVATLNEFDLAGIFS